MTQFGWPAMFRAVAITAIVTSGLWAAAGMVWYYRVGPGQADGIPAAGPPVASTRLTPMVSPVAPGRNTLGPAALAAATRDVQGTMIVPVEGVTASQLTDTFTQSRSAGRIHEAIDIIAPRGTRVIAAAAGTVERLFVSNQGGLTVYVRSPDRRLVYYYAHLDGYAAGLAEGQVVAAGAPLGRVGISGNASPESPHLHFAVMATEPGLRWYQGGTPINPYPLLTGKSG